MDTKQLKYFLEMAERLSFRETAEALYISQSALSRQIAELEKELGVKLFRRSTRKVELTDEGSMCLMNAQRIMDEADDMRKKVIRAAEDPAGSITIGCYINGRHTLFYELMYKLQSRYRMINADLVMGEMADIRRRFERNEIDAVIGLRAAFDGMHDLEFVTVESGQLYLIVPERHRFTNRTGGVSFEELRGENLFIKNEFTKSALSKMIKNAGFKNIKVCGDSSTSFASIIRVALGEGVVLMPAIGHEEALKNTGTVRIPVNLSDSSMFDEVIVRKKSNKNAVFKCLVNVVNEYAVNAENEDDAAFPLPISCCM